MIRKYLKLHWTRARLPGVFDDDEDGLVQSRTVGRVRTEKVRGLRRQGARTNEESYADRQMRSYGIPVYDRETGQSQLAELLQRGRGD